MFTGREYDAETGLYYYRNRYYDNGIGRFISVDPIGESGTSNLYTYCLNNSINLVDPRGLRAYIGGHEVRGTIVGGHTAIILQVEPQDEPYFIGNNNFKRNPATGRLECDVSAGSSQGRLTAYPFDTDRRGTVSKYVSEPINDPKGRSDIELFNDILDSASKYRNDLFYDPVALGGCYNSNSYVRGLLKDVGFNNPPLPTDDLWFPGWTKPIPIKKK
jgi:RHS repeat-associated protein